MDSYVKFNSKQLFFMNTYQKMSFNVAKMEFLVYNGHGVINSVLLLSVAELGSSTILYFSLVHSLQVPLMGLKSATFLSRILHCTLGVRPLPLCFQTYLERVVCLSKLISMRLSLWVYHLFLNLFASPI